MEEADTEVVLVAAVDGKEAADTEAVSAAAVDGKEAADMEAVSAVAAVRLHISYIVWLIISIVWKVRGGNVLA
jgi:hypothetical protein